MRTMHRELAVGLILVSLQLGASMASAQDREARDLEGFDSIAVGGGVDVYLRQGDGFRVEVDSARIDTDVRGGTLVVGRRASLFGWFSFGDSGAVYVTLPTLVSVTASGGSDVESEGRISGSELEIRASGGSDVALEVAVERLSVQTSGGSDVRLSGSALSASFESSGGSDLDARDLRASAANLRSSGGSDMSVTVVESLVARASGGSDISYAGTPASVDVESSGGADVTRR